MRAHTRARMHALSHALTHAKHPPIGAHRRQAERHTWNSQHFGSDSLKLRTDFNDWDQLSQTLYIGVRGRSLVPGGQAHYRLRVEVKDAKARRGDNLRGADHGVNSYRRREYHQAAGR